METTRTRLGGIWLPIITPFRDGALDETSLRRLIRHYMEEPVAGVIAAATTGEGLTLDEAETERLVEILAAEIGRSTRPLPIYLGIAGSDTRRLAATLERTREWAVDGYLVTCPLYSRPSQDGLYRHFAALADTTSRPILVYNIPYRTGVNLGNETMLRLAERDTIVGVKDCCRDATQSFELLQRRPSGFAVLTGEDALFYGALAQGADGGILASAHVETRTFASVWERIAENDLAGALAVWRTLADVPHLLFAEPSPAPIKHWLWRMGLIDSPELRLPMTGLSDDLARRIDVRIGAAPSHLQVTAHAESATDLRP